MGVLFQVTGRFLVPPAGELSRPENEERLQRDFEPLVDVLVDKYKRRGGPESDIVLPEDVDEVHKRFVVTYPSFQTGEIPGTLKSLAEAKCEAKHAD